MTISVDYPNLTSAYPNLTSAAMLLTLCANGKENRSFNMSQCESLWVSRLQEKKWFCFLWCWN